MWQRTTSRQTGTNADGLGAPRRWGNPSAQEPAPPAPPKQEESSRPAEPVDPSAPRKRRSRWGGESTAVATTGLPTAVTGKVNSQELENYANSMRLEEINKKLRSGDVVPLERDRSPSPPPQYDNHGRRTNTREVRYRKKLEDERTRLVDKQIRNDPNFRPPTEFMMQRRGRPQEKVYIPVKEFPEINFFGLLVGPRGNSLKGMERDSGAKISIRGKGSVKDGKGRPDAFAGDEDEELHALVVADHEDKVRKCVELINKVIETAASTPEGDNDHKRNQLRELALLNGTLRDDENQACQNCGKIGHRKYDCPEQRNFTANIICRSCGGAGHMARDCLRNKAGGGGMPGMPGAPGQGGGPQTAQFDSEYASLMAELGETKNDALEGSMPFGQVPVSDLPPWRNPANWHPPQPPQARDQRGQYNTYGQGGAYQGSYSSSGPGYPPQAGGGGYQQGYQQPYGQYAQAGY